MELGTHDRMELRVLVIDPSRESQKMLAWILERAGYCPQFAATEDSALDAFADALFDLVIVNLTDVDTDWIDLLKLERMAQMDEPPVPVVVLVPQRDDAMAAACRSVDVDELMIKPVDPRYLLQRVGHLAEAAAAHR